MKNMKTPWCQTCEEKQEKKTKRKPPAALPFHMLSPLVTVVIIKTSETHPDVERKQRSCDRGGYETSCSDEPFSEPVGHVWAVGSRCVVHKHTHVLNPATILPALKKKRQGASHIPLAY
ncbi:hypothetical protein ATANTOWER_021965 [Ataeniobius toweri]|uniref:Uncharacterized protein n=1 Tax=Ataeniobius toweri TaxID=208326 RepID=A0ABU7C3C8_9TELE|nr:hypothetical protein [Ataeniobius toweri]